LAEKVIVADEDLDFENEITLTEARKIEPDFEIGEEVSEE
jgi:N utilization substance protein A